jgi:hypothetical protein
LIIDTALWSLMWQWEAHTILDGYRKESATIVWLWKFVAALPQQERALLLK